MEVFTFFLVLSRAAVFLNLGFFTFCLIVVYVSVAYHSRKSTVESGASTLRPHRSHHIFSRYRFRLKRHVNALAVPATLISYEQLP